MYSILYVDDEEALLELGRTFLELDGTMTVGTVASAREALEQIASNPPDAVISDYQMPEMDGIEFLKAVRSRFGDLPFILFTGRGREEVVIEAINNGVDFYLQKGGEPGSQFAELAHKVRMAIDRRKTKADTRSARPIFNKAIFDSVPGILYLYDSDGRLVRWNKNHETVTGYSGAELAGRYVLDWFPDPADKETIRERRGPSRYGTGRHPREANLATRSGTRIPFLFTARRLEIGGRIYFTGIGIDITRTAESRRGAPCKRGEVPGDLRAEFRPDLCRGQRTASSPMSPLPLTRILGYTPEEVIGKPGPCSFIEEDLPKIRQGRMVKEQGGSFENFEIRCKTKRRLPCRAGPPGNSHCQGRGIPGPAGDRPGRDRAAKGGGGTGRERGALPDPGRAQPWTWRSWNRTAGLCSATRRMTAMTGYEPDRDPGNAHHRSHCTGRPCPGRGPVRPLGLRGRKSPIPMNFPFSMRMGPAGCRSSSRSGRHLPQPPGKYRDHPRCHPGAGPGAGTPGERENSTARLPTACRIT